MTGSMVKRESEQLESEEAGKPGSFIAFWLPSLQASRHPGLSVFDLLVSERRGYAPQ
jgi:hypothetical protein